LFVYVRGVDVRVAETVEISSPETQKKTKKENDAIIRYFVCGTTHDYLRHRRLPVSSPGEIIKKTKSQTTHQTYWPPIWPKKEVDAAHNTITKLTKRHKWKSTTTTTKETLKEDGHKTSQQVASRHENDDGGRPRYGHPIAQSILELTKFSLFKKLLLYSFGGGVFILFLGN
jgi:hypothetical protein